MSNTKYYHVYNRGVEKRNIFLDNADYFRFILGIEGFNNTEPLFNLHRFKENIKDISLKKKKEPIVKIVCYSLMPNHYHILLEEIKENGLSKFMQKVGVGYTKYFNKRYERTGVLFQSGFKSKAITTDEYLIHLSRYIHLNALSLVQVNWLKNGVMNKRRVIKFLKEYKWHSLPYWDTNKPCLIKLYPEIILEQFSSSNLEGYFDFLLDWETNDYNKIEDIILE